MELKDILFCIELELKSVKLTDADLRMKDECIQIAAMAVRFIVGLVK